MFQIRTWKLLDLKHDHNPTAILKEQFQSFKLQLLFSKESFSFYHQFYSEKLRNSTMLALS